MMSHWQDPFHDAPQLRMFLVSPSLSDAQRLGSRRRGQVSVEIIYYEQFFSPVLCIEFSTRFIVCFLCFGRCERGCRQRVG